MIALLAQDKMTEEEEPKMFYEAWNHLLEESCRKQKKLYAKNFGT